MNNLHYYTFLVQNVINTKCQIMDFGLEIIQIDTQNVKAGVLTNILKTKEEELLNHFESICELYFSLDENDQILKNRIVNLHKVEVEQLSETYKEKLKESSAYVFIHKFLDL